MSAVTLSLRERAPEAGGRAAVRGLRGGGSAAWLVPLAVLAAAVCLALIGPLLPVDGSRTVAAAFAPPGPGLPLGSDGVGRDVFARLLGGGAGLLGIAAVSAIVSVSVGIALGLAPSFPGPITRAVSAVLDVALVVPGMLVMLILVFGLGGGAPTMVLIMTVVGAPFVARFTRALTLPLLDAEFVRVARAAGDSWPTVAVREILPNLAGPLLTQAGANFVGALYLVAAAGFLGLNPLGAAEDWATMIQSGLVGLGLNPWAALAPALAVALITVPANLLIDRFAQRSQL